MSLKISAGQHSDQGRKPSNQDFHGLCVPGELLLGTKGVAIALADGISSSEVSQLASQAAVKSFLDDYYCTSDAWSVKTSVERVLVATNSWLYAQTQQGQGRYDKDRGHVCTFSALVLKSTTAHIFHVGDTRIYQVQGKALEQLTSDHRVWVGGGQSYLGRALGIGNHLDIEYRAFSLERGDTFVLATDGVYEHVGHDFILAAIAQHAHDLDQAARAIVAEALRRDSPDNLTVQIVRIDALPAPQTDELYRQACELPLPPLLEARAVLDGYTIVRELHGSSRSHIYLALDQDTQARVVIKTPSIDLQGDPAYLERFLLEEWVARRINSAHVLKPCAQTRPRSHLYVVMEFIEGQTLAQWRLDNPKPDLDAVRGIIAQIARGLSAFHRLEMLHQDLRPENVMIDGTGTVKIIDFGSTQVAGIMEMAAATGQSQLLGTAPFTAPEYFLGESGSAQSDLFSLAVLTYYLLTGQLPYGTQVAKCTSRAQQKRLRYAPVQDSRPDIPFWVDEAIRKALQPDPGRRYEDLSEFVFSLHQPDKEFLKTRRLPLIERNPVIFWKGVSLLLGIACLVLLGVRFGR